MKKEESQGKKQSTLLSIMLIIFLLLSVIGLTYSIFIYSKEGKVRNRITTGAITFSYNETSNGISLENAIPIGDDIGKKLESDNKNNGYFDFNVSCTMAGYNNIFYEVYTTKIPVESEIAEDYVKIYLTDGTTDQALSGYDNNVPTYNKLKDSSKIDGAKQLYYGNFTSSGIQKFRLRMWLSEDYMLASESKSFKIKVNVEADN